MSQDFLGIEGHTTQGLHSQATSELDPQHSTHQTFDLNVAPGEEVQQPLQNTRTPDLAMELGLNYGEDVEMSHRNPKRRPDHPCTSNPNLDLHSHLHPYPPDSCHVSQRAIQNTTPVKEGNINASNLTALSLDQHILHRSSPLELD